MTPFPETAVTFSSGLLTDSEDSGSLSVRRWSMEQAFVRARWCVIALLLITVPIYPSDAWPVVIGVAALLALANLGVDRLLRHGPASPSVIRACRFITVVEWFSAIAVLSVRSHQPSVTAGTILVMLILVTSARFRLPGLLVATVAAWIVAGLLVAAKVTVHETMAGDGAWRAMLDWTCSLAAVSVLLGARMHVGDLTRQSADLRHAADLEELTSFRCRAHKLTAREMDILRMLAQPTLTYAQIADRLFVSEGTVKRRVHEIGKKLGVSGREAVVQAARDRGLVVFEQPTTEVEKASTRMVEENHTEG